MSEIIIILAIIVGLLWVIQFLISMRNQKNMRPNVAYRYTAKTHIMTSSERTFYSTLNSAVSARYLIFPQIHLASLLNHKQPGQNWSAAFRHINGKSVDFVLCNKQTFEITYVIELDDHTHTRSDRVERDVEVERIFREAQLPLVRFGSVNVSQEQIIASLQAARTETRQP